MQTPTAPSPRRASSGHGCLIAALVVGGVLLLAAVTAGLLAYRFATSPEGKKVMGAIGEGVRMVDEASKAPGAAEIRELGCKQALVMKTARMVKLINQFTDAGTEDLEKAADIMVACMVASGRKGPSCDRVAKTYVGALGGSAKKRFLVMVKGQASSDPECVQFYSEKGVPLNSGAAPSRHALPESEGPDPD